MRRWRFSATGRTWRKAPSCVRAEGRAANWIAGNSGRPPISRTAAGSALTREAEGRSRGTGGRVTPRFPSMTRTWWCGSRRRAGDMGGDPVLELLRTRSRGMVVDRYLTIPDGHASGRPTPRRSFSRRSATTAWLVRGFADSSLTADIPAWGGWEHPGPDRRPDRWVLSTPKAWRGWARLRRASSPALPTTEATPLDPGSDPMGRGWRRRAQATRYGDRHVLLGVSRSTSRRACRCARPTRPPIPISTSSTAPAR